MFVKLNFSDKFPINVVFESLKFSFPTVPVAFFILLRIKPDPQ
jgi:hypothetical protein